MSSRRRSKRKKRGNPRASDAALERAQDAYRRTHWGEAGKGRATPMEIVTGGPLTVLGELVSVTYRTIKRGDDGETDYEHEFEGRLPVLVFDEGGNLAIARGKSRHKVTVRGIVG